MHVLSQGSTIEECVRDKLTCKREGKMDAGVLYARLNFAPV